jgi:hypothetical protein
MSIEINDKREKFNNISFSGFQKSKVKSELLKCIDNSKIENACYWSAELICAGHYIDLWNILINYMCKHINLGNPKLPIYLEMRYNSFKNIINNFNNRELLLRNNSLIRNLFCEIICILIFSNKKYKISEIKIHVEDISDFINISDRLKAPNTQFLDKFFTEDDPKEIFIPLNEFVYSIENKNLHLSSYWLEWIIGFENNFNKNNKILSGKNRMFAPKGFERNIIMIIWEIIFEYSKNKNEITLKICNSLFNLFCIKYNKNTKKKRKILLYFALQIIIDDYNYNISIINNKEKVENIISNIDNIYKDIKKNEESPGTDYLFKNIKNKNIEKSMYKLNLLNTIHEEDNISEISE